MFIEAIIFAIVIGYILNGRIKNLNNVDIKAVGFVFFGFLIEFAIIILIKKNLLSRGYITYFLDFIMYALIFLFAYYNRKNPYLLIMGIGFLLNAIPIFLNGGAMPVGSYAIQKAGLTLNVESEGLYRLVDANTRMWFLGDIIPLTFLRHFAISIGDIVGAIGLMLFIITSMKKTIKD